MSRSPLLNLHAKLFRLHCSQAGSLLSRHLSLTPDVVGLAQISSTNRDRDPRQV